MQETYLNKPDSSSTKGSDSGSRLQRKARIHEDELENAENATPTSFGKTNAQEYKKPHHINHLVCVRRFTTHSVSVHVMSCI